MRIRVSFVLVLALVGAAHAQTEPRIQVFGGYSLLHIDTQGVSGSTLDGDCNMISPGLCPPGTFKVHNYFNGWNAAAEMDITRWLGIKADFSGHYGKLLTLSSPAQSDIEQAGVRGFPPTQNSYSFLFGPVGYKRTGRYTPFAHGLFGANRFSSGTIKPPPGYGLPPSLSANDTALGMAFGGGLDLELTARMALRAFQADYLYTGHDLSFGVPGVAHHQNNFRVSAGIVLIWGQHEAGSEIPGGTKKSPEVGGVLIGSLGLLVRAWTAGSGIEVLQVSPRGAADLGGIRVADVINRVEDRTVASPEELTAALAGRPTGSRVTVGLLVRGMWQSEAVVVIP